MGRDTGWTGLWLFAKDRHLSAARDRLFTVTERMKVFLHGSTEGADDWWAECLLCDWVSTSNGDQRTAEMKFGRHFESDHARR